MKCLATPGNLAILLMAYVLNCVDMIITRIVMLSREKRPKVRTHRVNHQR